MKTYAVSITLLALALAVFGARENRKYARAQAEADTAAMLLFAKLLPSQIEIIKSIEDNNPERIKAIKVRTLEFLELYDKSLHEFKTKHPEIDAEYFSGLSENWKSEIKK